MKVEPVTGTIGAEVGGVDLADDLDDAVIAEIRNALLDWKVLFFRDQHRLDRKRHVAFGRRFGELEVHPATPAEQDAPEVYVLTSGGDVRAPDRWHADTTFRAEPARFSILRAVELPPLGGDTLWADMGKAYDLLDDATKELLAGRRAAHDLAAAHVAKYDDQPAADRIGSEYPTAEHPVVCAHPDTGRKTLYVNAIFTRTIVGMDEDASRTLLERLYRQASIPDVQCRLRWRPGTVAFWDNRSTQHIATSDFLPARRVMERVTVAGDRPL